VDEIGDPSRIWELEKLPAVADGIVADVELRPSRTSEVTVVTAPAKTPRQ
jgi:hypothetical protein